MPNPAPSGPVQLPATWNARAAGYAEYMVTHAAMYAERALEIVSLRPTDSVLDVAAGPGSLVFVAAPRVARVVAIDFADGMVEQIRTRAKHDGVSNVEAMIIDAQSLDFPEGSFDAAFCMFGFMFFPDRARAFRELCRVLRPGGRALVATWAPLERRPLMKVGFESLAEALPGLPPMTKGDLQQCDECVQEMSGGGFRDVTAQVFTASMHVDSAEHDGGSGWALPGAQEKARRRSMGASRSATSRRCAPPHPRAGRRSRGRGDSHRGHPLTVRSRLVLTRR